MKSLPKKLLLAAGVGIVLASTNANAQSSSDALIDKLVQKGVLTVKEANDLRDESEKDFNHAYAVKTGLPDWVTQLKLSGDFRARVDSIFADDRFMPATGHEDAFVDRTRFRMRLRFGATVTLLDNFELGFRLTSAEAAGGGDSTFGGNPLSGNSSFKDNGSKKFIYIDQAYGRWAFLNGPDVTGLVTVGKMENPFLTSDMVFDPDYTPEGLALQGGYRFNDRQGIKANLGAFMLDEFSGSSKDPYMVGAQIRWDATWTKRIATSFGVGEYGLGSPALLSATSVPNQNFGNTRNSAGALLYDYYPVVVDGALTYTLDSFPLYKGAFPVRVWGEYMNNPGAPSDQTDNHGWNVGLTFGKSGKRGTWDLSYNYKWLGSDAWYEEVVDDDFGAFYARAAAGPGAVAGYGAGTNVKGHIVRFAYSPTDALTLSVKYWRTELINSYPAGSKSDMNRLFIDAMLKF